jgi:hypothetical protein
MARRERFTRLAPAMGEREEPPPGLPWERGRGEGFLAIASPYGKNINNDNWNTFGDMSCACRIVIF